MSEKYDLVCIGSGPAGQRGAIQAAKLGRRVAVVEQRRSVGGVCLDTGTIPSKTFREAVLSHTRLDRRGARTVLRESRPLAADLLRKVDDVIMREAEVVENQLHRNGVDVFRGAAAFVDPHTIEVSSEGKAVRIGAANVLIACGTRPSPPPGVEIDGKVVLTSDAITCMTELPRRLAVVGAGVIGIEYASMFAALGVEVTIVDRRERPLEFLDREIVDEMIHQMRNASVIFRLGEAVESLEVLDRPGGGAALQLESGKRIVSDMVLFSVGRIGCTDSLNIEAAGIEADARGRLAVNEEFRTSQPHIFAAGDVIGYPSLAATSSEQGRIAACYAFDASTRPMSPTFPIGIYAIPEASMCGATEEELTRDKVPYETGVARYREIARGHIVGDESGFFKMIFHREDHRLLGVHIIGTGATELLHIGQAVLRLDGGLDYFLNTVFNYPTLAECYKVAALDAHNKLKL